MITSPVTSDKENVSSKDNTSETRKSPNAKLTPTWMFNAALVSSPVDLSSLVKLSREDPNAVLNEVGLLNRMVEKVLNAPGSSKNVDKDSRLDVLLILANCCKGDCQFAKEKVKKVLSGVTSFFESYIEKSEKSPAQRGEFVDPSLHKVFK